MSKSFDGAIALGQAIMADCDKPILDSLQIAHEHDMELADKAAYNRGYRDGQRSMDAEHRAVAMRLQMLRLNEGSHENLSAIARAVHPTEWSWTKGACANLLDKLIRLMGGVHDEPIPMATSGDAGGDDCHRRDGEAGRVSERDSQEPPILADSDGEDGGEATITDELRECVRTADRQYDDMPWYEMGEDSEADHTICLVTEGELLRIADGIDAQLKRICEQHEAVLQQTIDEMAEFREHEAEYAAAERDELTHDVEMWRDRAEDMRMERDELQAKLNAATHDDGAYKSKVELLLELILKNDRIEKLQAKLDAAREALDGQR